MNQSAGDGARLRVRQVRSGIGRNKIQNATLKAMGLGKVGRVREMPDNPQIRGMIFRVTHLVEIVPPGDDSSGNGR